MRGKFEKKSSKIRDLYDGLGQYRNLSTDSYKESFKKIKSIIE